MVFDTIMRMHLTQPKGAIMNVNKLSGISEKPPRADKSAPTDDRINLSSA
jgi:hypothetical protein